MKDDELLAELAAKKDKDYVKPLKLETITIADAVSALLEEMTAKASLLPAVCRLLIGNFVLMDGRPNE